MSICEANQAVLTTLPYDLLSHITTFLSDKDSQSLVCSCKELSEFGRDRGYLKKIKFNYITDPIAFSIACHVHRYTLEHVTTEGLDDVEAWCPVVKKMRMSVGGFYRREYKN